MKRLPIIREVIDFPLIHNRQCSLNPTNRCFERSIALVGTTDYARGINYKYCYFAIVQLFHLAEGRECTIRNDVNFNIR